MTGKRVLVTGASGFVGRQTIGPLLELSYDVHAVGSSETDPRARWYRADLLDQSARRKLLRTVRPHAVIHCAWVTKPGAYWTSPENLDWVGASLDLARAAVEAGAKRLLFVGTCAEYDWSASPGRPRQEDDPCRPATLYGSAKDSLRRLLQAFAATAGVDLIWPRLFHLYGPHEATSRLLPSVMTALREGRPATLESGGAVRDFMHVADAGRALAHLLARETRGVVNVASGQPIRIGDLAALIARIAGRPDLVPQSLPAASEPDSIVANIARLQAVGFRSAISLQDGLSNLWSDGSAVPDYDHAVRLYRQNRMDEARSVAQAVLAVKPAHPATLNLLGVLHRQRADFPAARDYLERAAALDPHKETAWINLGNVHLDMDDAEAAVAAFTRALTTAPQRADTLRVLGNALVRLGRDKQAIERLDAAVAALPDPRPALRDRARAHYAAGRIDAALADLDSALDAQPDDIETLLLKAQILRFSGRHRPAAALLRDLLARVPENPDVHLAMADALLSEERRDLANKHYSTAVALRPDDQQALGKLCWSLLNSRYGNESDHVSAAADIARRMVGSGVLHPASAHAVQSALLRVADLDAMAAFDAIFADRAALLDYWVRRNVVGALHAQLGRVRTMDDRLTLVDCHRRWGERYEDKTTPLRLAHQRTHVAGSRIRVGFVSSDLRHHPVTYFAQPIFDHYDRDRFEFFAYSFSPTAPDEVQRRIASQISAFRRLPNLPEQDIARRIADDHLDILFELGGSTHLNRLEVMAHQPAPIQVSWLGYPHSSGLNRIAHILVDPYFKPPDPRLLLERPFEMPSSWVCLGPLGFADQPITPSLPEQRVGRVTFGTMNNPYKYSPAAVALWARVLHQVPGSRFLFVRPEAGADTFRANMANAFESHGIAPDRLAYAAVRGRHMAHYNDIDIALDTLPQTGGTTTCECLWMGVPTISLIGPAFFERLSYSNLVNAGLGDLAVDTPDAYVDAAVRLAADTERRRALRLGLRDTIRRSPLGDSRQWVHDFQALTIRTLETSWAGGTTAAA